MKLASLNAFRHVSQRFQTSWDSPAGCLDAIAEIHSRGFSLPLQDRVPLLWQMEREAVYLGRTWRFGPGPDETGKETYMDEFLPEGSWPIVAVGMGAGVVARVGFDRYKLNAAAVRFPDEDLRGYFWEGVGHMVELGNHPVIAWILGMPRIKFPLSQNCLCLSYHVNDRSRLIKGFFRMNYLCGGMKDPGVMSGSSFGHAMTNYKKWCFKCIKTGGWDGDWCDCTTSIPGQTQAVAFVNKTWPIGGTWKSESR